MSNYDNTHEFISMLNKRSVRHITEILNSVPKGYAVIGRESTNSGGLGLIGSIKIVLGNIEQKDGYNVISGADNNVTMRLVYDFLINAHEFVYVELFFNNGKETYTLPTIKDAINCLKVNLNN